ncbi:MAG: alpha/beta fold hydrolase [Anaerolineae bacterium]
MQASIVLLLVLATACAVNAPTPSPTSGPVATSSKPWTEQEVSFTFGSNDLHGILTLPTGEGPFPAIVLISGSVHASTRARSGATSRYFLDHARRMVLEGFAVLRYDPPGVGQSTGTRGFESLETRTDEAMAALKYLQSRPEIQSDRVGLWGVSQGSWVIAMAAAAFPEDVAFIISDSGSGVSVAEQQIHSIEAQSVNAGLSPEDVAKAVLFGTLLIDWQLGEPLYREVNEADAKALGRGPWSDFLALVYEPGAETPAEGLDDGIVILQSIQDEPWAEFLYLKELYLPQLESIAPDRVLAVKAMAGQSLLNDPKDYLTTVRCPVLAAFGEEDLLQPSAKSAALYKEYLTEARNEDFEVVVIPGVGHAFGVHAPGYSELLTAWLDHLY